MREANIYTTGAQAKYEINERAAFVYVSIILPPKERMAHVYGFSDCRKLQQQTKCLDAVSNL